MIICIKYKLQLYTHLSQVHHIMRNKKCNNTKIKICSKNKLSKYIIIRLNSLMEMMKTMVLWWRRVNQTRDDSSEMRHIITSTGSKLLYKYSGDIDNKLGQNKACTLSPRCPRYTRGYSHICIRKTLRWGIWRKVNNPRNGKRCVNGKENTSLN